MFTTSFYPSFSECSKILHSVRASNLAWLPPAVHSNCSEWLWLHARTIFGCPGELFWLARRIKLEQFIRFEVKQLRTDMTYALSFSLFCPCFRQNANTTLSLQLPTKFGNIVLVETSRYLTKITTLQRKADRKQL